MRQIGLWLCCIKKLSKLLCLQLRKHKEIYFIFLHLHIVDVHLNLGVLIMLSAEIKHSWGIPCMLHDILIMFGWDIMVPEGNKNVATQLKY